MLPCSLSLLLLLILTTTANSNEILLQRPFRAPNNQGLKFQLRHIHATTNTSRTIFHDVSSSSGSNSLAGAIDSLALSSPLLTSIQRTYKPPSNNAFKLARQQSIYERQSAALDWTEDDIPGPDITDRLTVLELAKMTNNAYVEDDTSGEWYELSSSWNVRPLPLILPNGILMQLGWVCSIRGSVGSLIWTVFEATYSSRRIIKPSYSPSKEPRPEYSAGKVLHPLKIN